MDNYLSVAKIWGLWGGEKVITIPLDSKFNFIIGKNGTGKTTVINLLAAVLTADFERLDKITFSKVLITLRPHSGRRRPSIEVLKTQKPNLPYFDISYRVKQSAAEEAIIFDLDALEEERAYRGVPPRLLRERHYREKFLYVQRHLENLIRVSWLSVHRQTSVERPPEERVRHGVPAVDQKLADMNNSLVRYFSKMATNFSEETLNYQKTSFLSLISIQKDADMRAFVQAIDIAEEKKALASILDLLGVDQKKYARQLDQLVQQIGRAHV